MTEEIMEALNGQVFGVWRCTGILDAGRIRDGRGRFHQSEKHW